MARNKLPSCTFHIAPEVLAAFDACRPASLNRTDCIQQLIARYVEESTGKPTGSLADELQALLNRHR